MNKVLALVLLVVLAVVGCVSGDGNRVCYCRNKFGQGTMYYVTKCKGQCTNSGCTITGNRDFGSHILWTTNGCQ